MGSHQHLSGVPFARPTMNPTDTSRVALSSQTHGHEVIAMMLESGQVFTRNSLTSAIEARFGADARFYTCSAEGLTPGELIDFLDGRGKFAPRAGGFTIDAAKVCRH